MVFTDYQNLYYFTTSKVFNQCEVHWKGKLCEFDFWIVYRAGSKKRKPDVLSRSSEYALGEGKDPITLLKPEQIVRTAATILSLLVKRLDENIKLSIRGLNLAVGMDIMANQDIIILPNQRALISTGIVLATPPGTYARIASRSGLAVKHGIYIGTRVIDKDDRGEIKVVRINILTISFQVRPGYRIVQLMFEKILKDYLKEMQDLFEMISDNQGFSLTAMEEILISVVIFTIKASKFHPGYC
jgi:dUTP pyrophosphatase